MSKIEEIKTVKHTMSSVQQKEQGTSVYYTRKGSSDSPTTPTGVPEKGEATKAYLGGLAGVKGE